MAVTSYKSSGTQANADRDSKAAWSNPSYASGLDDNRAIADVAKSTYSDWLRLTNFGFTGSDVPSGATIDGIEVVIQRQSENEDNVSDSAIYLRNGSAAQAGDNKATATGWPTTDTDATYGGAADDWNASLTQADVIDTDFGIDISADNDNAISAREARVDDVKIRIYYTVSGIQVNKDLQIKYDIRELVYDDVQIKWDITEFVYDDVQIKWDIFDLVGDELQLKWDIRELAGDELQLKWDIRELVYKDIQTVWDILNLVNKNIEVKWDILNLVGVNIQAKYDIRELVGKELQFIWDILNLVGQELQAKWDIKNLVTKNIEAKWDILNLVTKSIEAVWDMRMLVYKSLIARWDILNGAPPETGGRKRSLRQTAYRWASKVGR